MNPITKSSGNVFEDLLLSDAPGLLAKARLTREIAKIIEQKKLTQGQAAHRMGVDQAKVSALLHGRLEGFSIERLIRFLDGLDQDVELRVKPRVVTVRRIQSGVVKDGSRFGPFEDAARMATRKHYFVEQTEDRRYAIRAKGSTCASEIRDTQREAIDRVHELNPNDHPDVERVRDTKVGGRDKWRPTK
jgi:predicted XRE-type DNA-binding protein